MSTRLLYQALGIRGYQCRRIDYFEGSVCYTVEKCRCPHCGSAGVHGQGVKDHSLQTVPIGLK